LPSKSLFAALTSPYPLQPERLGEAVAVEDRFRPSIDARTFQ
jgi:hypothetical protein